MHLLFGRGRIDRLLQFILKSLGTLSLRTLKIVRALLNSVRTISPFLLTLRCKLLHAVSDAFLVLELFELRLKSTDAFLCLKFLMFTLDHCHAFFGHLLVFPHPFLASQEIALKTSIYTRHVNWALLITKTHRLAHLLDFFVL